PGAIGDSLLALPVLQALRKQYNATHITYVSNPAVLPLARAWEVADEVSDFERPYWGKIFLPGRWPSALQQEGAIKQPVDMAICWLPDPEGIVEANMRAAGIAPVIVAPGRPSRDERIHIVEYLARTAGLHVMFQNFPWPPSALIQPAVPVPSSPRIALHPGSGGAVKCWPVASYAALIRELWQREVPVLLLAGPAEHERLAELRHLLGSPHRPELLEYLVDAPLLVVAQYLVACRGYLGNDTGITHLAAMLGLPTLVLFGPSDPQIWRPIGPAVSVLQASSLPQLPVATVLTHLEKYLL
ncbi:MAG TPA: glycosyltransferase family 9 protein, partial [Ktedonobacteraceae bacterium]|nr:glycosyltransferase family 9 protein [Ktedonobacteraceae bacterium]